MTLLVAPAADDPVIPDSRSNQSSLLHEIVLHSNPDFGFFTPVIHST